MTSSSCPWQEKRLPTRGAGRATKSGVLRQDDERVRLRLVRGRSLLPALALIAACMAPTGAFEKDVGVVLVGAGDIATCDGSKDERTGELLDSIAGTVFTAGDNAYESGTAQEFATCYDPAWGRVKDRTRPAPGNHEYNVPAATGYFGYFGSAAGKPGEGYYSYGLGAWHVVSLNSNCGIVSWAGGSPQYVWLE